MVRRLCLFLITLLYIEASFAQKQAAAPKFNLKQRFISSFGATHGILNNSSEKLYGINATPSLNLLNSFSDFSISLALNVGASYHPSSGADSNTYYSYSIPAFIQVNAGHLASQDFYAAIGLFVGAGYNMSRINDYSDGGFSWTAGFRFWLFKQSFTLRYVQSHLTDANDLLHEMSVQINVGKYLSHVKDNNKLSKFVSPFRK
jgi:hypothetical protein